ncbi:hypothetical protein QSJ18_15350 [Gordonia sp. ABSL1-1]|uniref:hypothetical protein n=1 Tax=Gordonia sp. ABSL1-1 TaxID=3053923 RepID=UPI002572E2D1|nr:hypothetical protein [Gordonia sp. ABSL1-1]MDL9938128.1 hypothetical protein [Gordonia sp. ABSL1-1]
MTTPPGYEPVPGGYSSQWGYQAQPPTFWLDPGPSLPRRSWQRRSRRPVIALSVVGAVLLAVLAVLALSVGVIRGLSFDADGQVAVDCETRTATVAGGGRIAAGDEVTIFAATGARLGSAKLVDLGSGPGARDCVLGFTVSDVDVVDGGYVVALGKVYSQTVTEDALRSGVVLRPV